MRGIDGAVRVGSRDGAGRWPENAALDLAVTSDAGPSAAVYLTASDVVSLIARLNALLPPQYRFHAPRGGEVAGV